MTRGIPQKGDVLFTTEAPLGNVTQLDTDEKVVFAQRVIIFQPNRGVLDSTFLKYLLLSNLMQERIQKEGTGATVKGIKAQLLKKIPVSFPRTLTEQKRIVSIVDEAFEGIDRAIVNTEKNLNNARELFESYLNTVFTQKGEGWEETNLGDEIELMTGFPFKSNQYTDSDESIRLLRGDNIVQGALRWDDVKKWPKAEIAEFLTYQLREGDVVLAMDRPWVKAGLKHSIISRIDLPCLLVQRTACLRSKKSIDNRFLLYLIGSHAFIRHILSNQTGIGVPHISGKQIQSFEFFKPSLHEQNLISDNLDKLRLKTQRLEAIYKQKLAAIKELKQSILQKAFTGELTADRKSDDITHT
jgi:type I restriction enzyme S subunit